MMHRIPEPPFRCGFQPERKSYARYVEHIRMCQDRDCERRFTNHMLMQVYFARKYGAEGSGTIPANVNGYTANVDPASRQKLQGVAETASSRAVGRAERAGVGAQDNRRRP